MAEDLSQMISIPSVNNSECWDVDNEMAFQEWMARRMGKLGLEVDMWADDPAGVRPNVVGTLKGTGGGRDLMLNGHSDVVPACQPEKWDFPPFSGKIIDGKVYGRGSSDMKGGLASYIWAIEALRSCGVKLRGNVFLASSVGEESGEGATIGAASVAKRGYRPSFALVAEGTNLELRIASSSIFMFEFIVKGKAVHGACRNQVIFPQPYACRAGPRSASTPWTRPSRLSRCFAGWRPNGTRDGDIRPWAAAVIQLRTAKALECSISVPALSKAGFIEHR
jgi:acetylornithine deacetylase